jgi:hypothetical protein
MAQTNQVFVGKGTTHGRATPGIQRLDQLAIGYPPTVV